MTSPLYLALYERRLLTPMHCVGRRGGDPMQNRTGVDEEDVTACQTQEGRRLKKWNKGNKDFKK